MTNTKNIVKNYRFVALCGILLLLLTFISSGSVQGMSSEDITLALDLYSQKMNQESCIDSNKLSNMDSLVCERKEYYKTYFNEGLHSTLLTIESDFMTPETVNYIKDTVQITVVEKLTFTAHYNLSNPEEFPLVQSALWAIEHNDNEIVDYYLHDYLSTTMAAVTESVKADRYEEAWLVAHDMTVNINSKEVVTDLYQILGNDTLPENDTLVWKEKSFERSEPNFENFPDHKMYTIPIEVLGTDLLAFYTSALSEKEGQIASPLLRYTYSGSNAAWYINHYTSKTTNYCPGSTIFQDKTKYNASYNSVTDLTGCTDCANYVSQALRYGGLPTDGEWYPYFYSYPWIRVDELIEYLEDSLRGCRSQSLYNLSIGHLVYIPSNHVAMIGALAPYRYSGHTNDRYLKAAAGMYTNFFGIFPYPPE